MAYATDLLEVITVPGHKRHIEINGFLKEADIQKIAVEFENLGIKYQINRDYKRTKSGGFTCFGLVSRDVIDDDSLKELKANIQPWLDSDWVTDYKFEG